MPDPGHTRSAAASRGVIAKPRRTSTTTKKWLTGNMIRLLDKRTKAGKAGSELIEKVAAEGLDFPDLLTIGAGLLARIEALGEAGEVSAAEVIRLQLKVLEYMRKTRDNQGIAAERTPGPTVLSVSGDLILGGQHVKAFSPSETGDDLPVT